jgi:hypothetical protein
MEQRQFRAFATLLYEKIWKHLDHLSLREFGVEARTIRMYNDEIEDSIAKYLADFALYVLEHVPADKRAEWGDPEECLPHIPDMP